MADSILLNGKIHDWTDVAVRFNGLDIGPGVTAINWKINKSKELQYGSGTEPIGVGYGKKAYSCDFTLTLEAAGNLEILCNAAGKSLVDGVPFLIFIQYSEKSGAAGGPLVQTPGIRTVTLLDVDVTDEEESADEGTMKTVRKYTALCGKILIT